MVNPLNGSRTWSLKFAFNLAKNDGVRFGSNDKDSY